MCCGAGTGRCTPGSRIISRAASPHTGRAPPAGTPGPAAPCGSSTRNGAAHVPRRFGPRRRSSVCPPPLRLSSDAAVFVDRGWAPSADALHVDRAALREGEAATVTGLAYAAPRGRGDVDPTRLTDSLPYSIAPFIIQALHSDRPTVRPSDLVYWPAPEPGDGPHLSYAIQWFAFAGTVILAMGALIRKQAREREASNVNV